MEENNTVNTAETVSTAETAAGAPDKPTFDQVLSDPDYRRAFDERIRAAVGRRFRTVDAQRAQMRQLAGDMARYLGLAPGEDGSVDLNALRAALNAGEDDPSSAPAGRHLIRHGFAAPRLPATPREGRAAGGANTLGVSPQGEGLGENQGTAPEDSAADPIAADFRAAVAEGEGLRQIYPGFDLGRELADPRFARVLVSLQRGGVPQPVRLAFETAHRRELMGGALRRAVERTAAQVAEGIRSGSLRPAENGGGAAADTRPDPAHLSPQQRRDIRDRVMRGERVVFR